MFNPVVGPMSPAFFAMFIALLPRAVEAVSLRMPGGCSTVSTCSAMMSSGDTLVIGDGTYGDAIVGIKAGTVIQAENDGKVKFTGSFNPGNAGFTMRGIVVQSNTQKELGAGNTYQRMSFVGGPPCGNVVNSLMGSNTKISDSAFYGSGGRYLLLAYKQKGGVEISNVIFRPDGGWGQDTACNESEPHAAYNMYDTEGFSITGAIVVDAISSAGSASENIGGQVVNTHEAHGNVGIISQSVVTASGDFGRFASDGLGSHNVSIVDSVSKGNTMGWGITRNCGGTTTATRFDSDKKVEAFKGSVSRTTGANLVLNASFLNDSRWKREMCADAGVTRGFCATAMMIGDYVASKIGASLPTGPTPTPTPVQRLSAPVNLR